MGHSVEREIEELHAFFEDWFTGRLPESGFERFERSMDADFTLVTPDGRIVTRADLSSVLRLAHGTRAGEDFRIEVREVASRPLSGDLHLATYQEWQTIRGRPIGRVSSALLRPTADAPGGLAWVHVHEVWLPS